MTEFEIALSYGSVNPCNLKASAGFARGGGISGPSQGLPPAVLLMKHRGKHGKGGKVALSTD